jgi:hypothetical protein
LTPRFSAILVVKNTATDPRCQANRSLGAAHSAPNPNSQSEVGKMNRREYLRNYQRQWIAKRRMDFFSTQKCSKCQSTERLELHHRDRDSKVTSSIWSWSGDRRQEELEKCEVLCHDCHSEITKQQTKEWTASPIVHGVDESGYRRGCRCDECRASYSVKRKDRWKRIRK